MTQPILSHAINEFVAELGTPGMLWQLGTLAFCIVAGWGIARLIRNAFLPKDVQGRVVRLGVESFSSVVFPLAVLTLVAIARPILGQWHNTHLLRLAIPLASSFAIIHFIFYVLRRIFVRAGGQAGRVLQAFEKVLATIVWCGVALYITGVLPEVLKALDEIVVPLGRNKVSILTILQAGASVFVTLLLALWAGAALEERVMRIDTVHSSLRVVAARVGKAVMILVAVLLSLSLVGIDLTVLSVFGGALGVGIGLGLQKLASSYVSGFVILLERSLTIGDMVNVDKYSGKVTQINARYTIVQGLDGTETVVPNDLLVSGAVQNLSLTDRVVRVATTVSVAYETDIEDLLPRMEAVAASFPRVLKNPPPAAMLLRFGADGFDLELGFWIADPENGRGGLVSEVNLALWRLFRERGISIPFAQREIRILNDA